MNIYEVIFKDKGKGYYFKIENVFIPNKVTVIVETEKGLQFGRVVKKITDTSIKEEDIKNIIRITTKKDYEQYLKNLKDAEIALQTAREEAKKNKLNMNFIDASFTFDRKQLLFNFYADQRVDFRELAKILAAKYKTRIELRQIGARDKASEVSGIGVCGRKLCCAGCYKVNESITMQMAKNQNIALNPSKINGACGRLLCCLSYEDKEYVRCSKQLPSIGATIKTPNGEGKVVGIDILNLNCKVLAGEEIVEVKINDEKDA